MLQRIHIPLEYLASIVEARFPLVVRRVGDVDSVRLLKAAELITERGERALRSHRLPEARLQRGRHPLDDD
ncbi:MAG: hypothetical protein QM586_00125 [Xenophilus sp.]